MLQASVQLCADVWVWSSGQRVNSDSAVDLSDLRLSGQVAAAVQMEQPEAGEGETKMEITVTVGECVEVWKNY